ncbi:MAG: hypothetical protein D6768_16195 [Chloroflexi bacterium]|nr:MAG: hypothetical protein D6768_16195 [Chloroflexota bacterium]
MHNSPLNQIVAQASERLEADLHTAMPEVGAAVNQWLRGLSGTANPADYFLHPLAFPSLLLPWWLDGTLNGNPDAAVQAELVYSTINGYYAIRLVDNVMDGHATVEPQLLPVVNYFQTRFQSVYQQYFPAGHPFWEVFNTCWFRSAEAAVLDSRLTDIDAVRFREISAQKVCAAKIPLAAVCFLHGQPERHQPWAEFVDAFGAWHQMLNDTFDWHKDLKNGTATWFLSEAERQRRREEPVVAWVAREGLDWAIATLDGWMADLQNAAARLACAPLADYLTMRQQLLEAKMKKLQPGLRVLAKISNLGADKR